jgi:hypothetical protein
MYMYNLFDTGFINLVLDLLEYESIGMYMNIKN